MSELVTDYLEGRVPPGLGLRMRWHLWCCGACRAYFGQMRKVVGLLGRLPDAPPGEDTDSRLMARLVQPDSKPPAA